MLARFLHQFLEIIHAKSLAALPVDCFQIWKKRGDLESHFLRKDFIRDFPGAHDAFQVASGGQDHQKLPGTGFQHGLSLFELPLVELAVPFENAEVGLQHEAIALDTSLEAMLN